MEQMPFKQKRKLELPLRQSLRHRGAGGVGMIRISGEHAREIADRIFTSPHGKKIVQAKGYTALYGNVHKPYDEGEQPEILDEAIALIFSGPASLQVRMW